MRTLRAAVAEARVTAVAEVEAAARARVKAKARARGLRGAAKAKVTRVARVAEAAVYTGEVGAHAAVAGGGAVAAPAAAVIELSRMEHKVSSRSRATVLHAMHAQRAHEDIYLVRVLDTHLR